MKGGNHVNYTIDYLYEEYKNDVYFYLVSLTHNKSLSEDLTSETFLSAIRSLPTFKGNSTIKTWLFGIARNKWYEHLKKENRSLTKERLLEVYTEIDMDIEETAIKKECFKRIYQFLEEQSDRQKGIFLMRVEGYSFAEIAEKFSIAENSARVIHFRLRNKIKTILTKEGYIYE